MATTTQTGAGGGQGGGGPVVRETRAIEAAAAGPVFRTPTMARVEQQSQKVADRWAPDGAEAEKQQPSLRALGFADRMIVGYLGGGTREPARDERERSREQTQTTQPQAPAQQGTGAPAQATTGPGGPPAVAQAPAQAPRPEARNEARPREPIARTRSAGAVDRAVPNVSWLFPTPWFEDELKWAAAAKAATRESERAAARTGERITRDERPSRDARATGVGVPLELVAPSMAAQRQAERVPAQQTAEARPAPAAGPSAALRAYSPLIDPAAARAAELLAGMARREAAQARKQAQGDDAAARPAPILEYVAPADLAAQRAASAETQAAAQRTLEPAPQPKTPDAPKAKAPDSAAEKAAAEKAAADKRSATASELLARSTLSRETDRVAPAAGPRVMLPAGLGGLHAATQAARTMEQPAARTEARAAAPTPAAPMVGRDRPAALDHLVWSDRWLARFAGASASALKTFDVARTPVGSTTEKSAMSGWDPAWVKPPPVARSQRVEAAEARPRPAPEMVVPARSATVDEAEPVSDADFGAIAAAASADRARQQARAKAPEKKPTPAQSRQNQAAAAKVEPPAPPRAPAADRALEQVKPSRSAGLGASLGASPVAPLLANLVDVPPQKAFDARQLSAASLASLPPVTTGRGAKGLRELAGRAPDEVFVSPEDAQKKAAAEAEKRSRPVVAPKPEASDAEAAVVAAKTKAEATEAKAKADARARAQADAQVDADARAEAKARAQAPAKPAPDAARPGNIGSGAETFAQKRALAASDLSLDFLSPEVLQAARAYGFGPIDAARAQRLAASGRPRIADLASQVDRVFVEALSSSPADKAKAQADAAAESTRAKAARAADLKAQTDAKTQTEAAQAKARADRKAAEAAAVAPPAPTVQPLRDVAPPRTPRGAFLLPDASARALGVSGKNAEEARPDIRFALDLVAAGHVADAATARAASPETGAAAERPPAPAVQPPRASADDRRDPNEARALLPRELWSVFDIVYLSLGESSSAGADGRPLAPAARAAKALALTSKSRDGGELPLSARARAAAAWAVLPTVIAGGSARDKATGAARQGAAGKAPSQTSRPVVSGDESPRFEAPRLENLGAFASTRAGESLGSLVAPSFVAADGDRRDEDRARAQSQARAQQQVQLARQESTTMSTPVVQTGVPPQRQADPPPQPRPEPAPAQRSTQPRHYSSQPTPPDGDLPAWFQDAAKKYFNEAGGASGGMSLAELTLVTAAPQAQVAASAASAARPVTQAETTSAVGASGGSSQAAQQAETKADIDKIAQEVFEQICRMLDVARERSGDPWQR